MSEKRVIVTLEDGFGRVQTSIATSLSAPQLMDKIMEIDEQQDTIQRMKHSLNTIYTSFEKHYGYDMRNAVWLIDELSYDEFENMVIDDE